MFISATPPPCQIFGCYDEEDPSTHSNTASPLVHKFFRIFTKPFTCNHVFCSACLKAQKQSCNKWKTTFAYRGEEEGWEGSQDWKNKKIDVLCPICKAPERYAKAIKIVKAALTILALLGLIVLLVIL
jgi:hypothetical protein